MELNPGPIFSYRMPLKRATIVVGILSFFIGTVTLTEGYLFMTGVFGSPLHQFDDYWRLLKILAFMPYPPFRPHGLKDVLLHMSNKLVEQVNTTVPLDNHYSLAYRWTLPQTFGLVRVFIGIFTMVFAVLLLYSTIKEKPLLLALWLIQPVLFAVCKGTTSIIFAVGYLIHSEIFWGMLWLMEALCSVGTTFAFCFVVLYFYIELTKKIGPEEIDKAVKEAEPIIKLFKKQEKKKKEPANFMCQI